MARKKRQPNTAPKEEAEAVETPAEETTPEVADAAPEETTGTDPVETPEEDTPAEDVVEEPAKEEEAPAPEPDETEEPKEEDAPEPAKEEEDAPEDTEEDEEPAEEEAKAISGLEDRFATVFRQLADSIESKQAGAVNANKQLAILESTRILLTGNAAAGVEAKDDLVAAFGQFTDSCFKPEILGAFEFEFRGGEEARDAYMAMVTGLSAVVEGDPEAISPESFLSEFRGKYTDLGQVLYSMFFAQA